MNTLIKTFSFFALGFSLNANAESFKSKLMIKDFIGKGVISCESYNGGRFIFDFKNNLTGHKELNPYQKIVEVKCKDDPEDKSNTGCQITVNASTDSYSSVITKYYFNDRLNLTHWESIMIDNNKEVHKDNTYQGFKFGLSSRSTMRISSPYTNFSFHKKSPQVFYSCN